jgi:hypothetical protein
MLEYKAPTYESLEVLLSYTLTFIIGIIRT